MNLLADSVLSDFFTNSNLRTNHNRKQQKNRYPQVLESIDSNEYKSLRTSQSTNSFQDMRPPVHKVSSSKSSVALKPLPVNDYHRVSDLMHRVSAVSGYTPDKEELSPTPLSNTEIAANMPNYQLKAMKESNSLRDIMEKVIQLHQELENIISAHLMHRKELGQQVEEVNNRYIKLFEVSLSEMLKTQRAKFKVSKRD